MKYHPKSREIKDEKKLRLIPRCGDHLEKFEFSQLHKLQAVPRYRPFFEDVDENDKNSSFDVLKPITNCPSRQEIEKTFHGRDTYEAFGDLTQINFRRTDYGFRRALYERMWRRSAKITPTDITFVLKVAAAWMRVGIKPCNLYSEAFQLLPSQFSREAAVLCAFYRGMAHRNSLPQDAVIFPELERFLVDEVPSLSILELEVIADGFFRSFEPFRTFMGTICGKILDRLYEELSTVGWDRDKQSLLKLLKMNDFFDVDQMLELGSVLEAGGFFQYCLDNPDIGFHELMTITGFLVSKRFKDDALLDKIVETLRILTRKKKASLYARCKDVGRLFHDLILLDAKLDEDLIEFALGFFRGRMKKGFRDIDGRYILIFLEGLSLAGVYPHDLIDHLLSSERFMVVEREKHMPYLGGKAKGTEPFDELLLMDRNLELFCPEYTGSRLKAEVSTYRDATM